MTKKSQTPDFTRKYINLASPRLGTTAVSCSDDFFAAKERMLADSDPVFYPDKYDDNGKWMDGWESRRRRHGGHDWCVVRLGGAGQIRGVELDTSHFTGNFPPAASLEALFSNETPDEDANWSEILPKVALEGDSNHFFEIADEHSFNYLRLNILPDGGIARLRVFGEPVPQWEKGAPQDHYELSALKNGGRILDYNDAHYGNVWTMLTEGRGINMGDGWETRRRREPGHDWIIVKLGAAGIAEQAEVDTAFYRGNYPDRCSLEGALGENGEWVSLLGEEKLSADAIHNFTLEKTGPIDRVRLNIFPDGGISRLRIFGKLAE